MTIIKERQGQLCSIRTDTYAHHPEHFNELAMDAFADYPSLHEEDIEVVRFAGSRIWGIQFVVPNGAKPLPEYTETVLEPTV